LGLGCFELSEKLSLQVNVRLQAPSFFNSEAKAIAINNAECGLPRKVLQGDSKQTQVAETYNIFFQMDC
jgi:hypothetical protein